jgi:hypothetical protein
LLAIPLAVFADFLMLSWMANRMVVHDSPDDFWSKITDWLMIEAVSGFVLIYIVMLVCIKVSKRVAA